MTMFNHVYSATFRDINLAIVGVDLVAPLPVLLARDLVL